MLREAPLAHMVGVYLLMSAYYTYVFFSFVIHLFMKLQWLRSIYHMLRGPDVFLPTGHNFTSMSSVPTTKSQVGALFPNT